MNTLFKILFAILIITQVSWIYFIPPLYKFVIKYSAYKRLFPPEDIFHVSGPNVTVTLSLGSVTGSTIKPNLLDNVGNGANGVKVRDVHQFLGIPFATPPIKELRFQKPRPVKKWSPNVIEGFLWKPSCLQNDRLFGLLQFASKDFSEDCLYLNIWTPSLPPAPKDASSSAAKDEFKLKPVFVWIYGGGFSIGGANQNLYHGHILSSTQDMVVVTFNYRLGPLGFLVSPDVKDGAKDPLAPGNAGLWDQVAALEWVQDHIQYFGGDPNQVTISGESAGSLSASALFLSPVTKNLFNNIITMSGSSLITTAFRKRENEIVKTRKLASIVGCPSDDDKRMMQCLLKVEGQKMIITDKEVIRQFPGQESFATGIMIFSPVSGDELVPFLPKDVIQDMNGTLGDLITRARSKVRVMTGVVNFEGGIMRLGKRDENSILKKLEAENSWREGIINWLMNDLKITEEDASEITEAYLYDLVVDKTDGRISKRQRKGEEALFNLIGDYYLTCPAYFETELINPLVKSVNSYVFSFKPERNELINIICPDKDKVCHGTELGYFFGGPLTKASTYFYDDQDVNQARDVLNLIGNFVRNEKLMVNRKKVVKRQKRSYEDAKDVDKKTREETVDEVIEWKSFDTKLKTSLEMNVKKNNPFVFDWRGKYCNLFRKYMT